jgi:alanyl-tRNA synthetase
MGEAVKLVKAGRPNTAFMFFGVEEGAVAYTCAVPESLVAKGFSASDWANQVKDCLGGRGGGKDELAQGTGSDESKVGQCCGHPCFVL